MEENAVIAKGSQGENNITALRTIKSLWEQTADAEPEAYANYTTRRSK